GHRALHRDRAEHRHHVAIHRLAGRHMGIGPDAHHARAGIDHDRTVIEIALHAALDAALDAVVQATADAIAALPVVPVPAQAVAHVPSVHVHAAIVHPHPAHRVAAVGGGGRSARLRYGGAASARTHEEDQGHEPCDSRYSPRPREPGFRHVDFLS